VSNLGITSLQTHHAAGARITDGYSCEGKDSVGIDEINKNPGFAIRPSAREADRCRRTEKDADS
jgi:hypothetical protein